MMEMLLRLEQTDLGTWIRESPTLWAYPTVLFLHTVGLAFLVGVNVAIDLRLLGVASALPLRPFRRLFPVMWAGFWVNALSGAGLVLADASTKLTNPIFYVKMAFIGFGVLNMVLFKAPLLHATSETVTPPSPRGRAIAWTSLAIWIAATTAGRLMGYLGPKSGLE